MSDQKIKLEIEADNNNLLKENFGDAKNRLTVLYEENRNRNPFLVRPAFMSLSHSGHCNDGEQDYFYEDEIFLPEYFDDEFDDDSDESSKNEWV